ncbi:MAG: helix-turn-helix domain-containing protein [Patescibacteria group bacterium]
MKIKTTWEFSLDHEAQRLIHVTSQISVGFFKVNGFYPVPYGSVPPQYITVLLPDLPFLTIPRFWEKVAKIPVSQMHMIDQPILTSQLKKLLINVPTPPDISKIKTQWEKISEKFFEQVYALLPNKKGLIKEIIIWPTNFGTSCSFSKIEYTPGKVYVWLRADQGIESIGWAILSALTRQDLTDHLGGLWQESQILVDWLMNETVLAKFFSHPRKTMYTLRSKQNATMLEISTKFLTKIGAPNIDSSVIKEIDTTSFTLREKRLLDLLIAKSPQIVTFDEINELLTNNYEQFSLYAISKSIQRLRDRLEKSGISGSFIQTKRGEGYLLVN